MQTESQTEQMPKSSRVGRPFWLSVLITVAPFTLFVFWFGNSVEPQPWWKILLAILIGLAPALVVGLIVQTLWAVIEATIQKRFKRIDYLLMLLVLCLSGIGGIAIWKLPESQHDTILNLAMFLLFSLVVAYGVRSWSRSKGVVARKETESNQIGGK